MAEQSFLQTLEEIENEIFYLRLKLCEKQLIASLRKCLETSKTETYALQTVEQALAGASLLLKLAATCYIEAQQISELEEEPEITQDDE